MPLVEWSNWLVKKAYGNVYRLTPSTTDRCITMTGAAVDTTLRLSSKHRIVKLEISNLTSAYAETIGMVYIKLFRPQGKVEDAQYFSDTLWENNYDIAGKMTRKFGEGDEYEETTWTLRIIAESTNKMAVAIYVQVED